VDAIENADGHQNNQMLSMPIMNQQTFFNDPHFRYSSFRTVFPHVSSFALQ